MPQFPGRYFPVRRQGLGDLPETALMERGEYGPQPPYGQPPQGGSFTPDASGNQAVLAQNQSNWQSIPFGVDTAIIRLQGQLARKFLLLQNLSGTTTLYFGFGWQPNVTNALTLPVGFGYEPFSYPTNEIYVVSSAAGGLGLLIYGS
jgi:hypothetical protein